MKKLLSFIFLTIFLFTVSSSNAFADNTDWPSGWVNKSSVPTMRINSVSVTGANGKIYVIGGWTGSAVLDTVEEYDPSSDSWSAKTSMPTARSEAGATLGADGKIYVVGGNSRASTFPLFDKVEVYDPSTDSWSTKASMPNPRTQLSVVTGNDGKIYAIGGVSPTGIYGDGAIVEDIVEVYDPNTNSWSTNTSMPSKRFGMGAVKDNNGYIYLIGGIVDNSGTWSRSNIVERYDTTNDTWTQKTNLPNSLSSLSAVYTGGYIYTFGGNNGSQQYNDTYRYDISGDSWLQLTDLPYTVSEHNSVISGGKIYNIGGNSASFTINTVIESAYRPVISTISNSSLNTGDTYTYSGIYTDPDSSSWSSTINYGDGTGNQTLTTSGGVFNLSHVYSSYGVKTLTVTITDDQGLVGTSTAALTLNARPQINSVTNTTVNLGSAYSVNGSITDPDSASWIASVDYGDGGGSQSLSLSGTNFTLNHTYSTHGSYTVTVTVTDAEGAVQTVNASITVNAAPHINTIANRTIDVGDTYTQAGSFSDTESTSWTATVDYGDGGGFQALTLAGSNFTLSHTYTSHAQRTITIHVTDNQSNQGVGTAVVVVNGAPEINNISNSTINVGSIFTGIGSFVDNESASWSATINYGDGGGTQPLSLSGKNFSMSHTYSTVGSFTVTVSVKDDRNLIGNKTYTVTVQRQLVSLNSTDVWIGLGANNNAGIKFDIKTELYVNGSLISTGQLNSVNGGSSSQFSGAVNSSISFASFTPVNFPSTSTLNIKIYVRNACTGSTKTSGSAKLWYNSSAANSRFGATVGTGTNSYYLTTGSALLTTTGTSQTSVSANVGAQCGPFVQLGSWSKIF